LKATLEAILGALPVLNYCPAAATRLQYKVGPAGLAGALLQQDPDGRGWLPVASHSRTLTAQELLMSRPHLELRAVQEALTKLRHVAAYCKELTVEASEELITIFRLQPRLHPQLWALVADIQAYKPKLVRAPPTKQLPYLAMLESVGDWEQLEGELGVADPTPEL
jgi:RNase H-like domain found in reverse transcriptase